MGVSGLRGGAASSVAGDRAVGAAEVGEDVDS